MPLEPGRHVVELGGGTGAITRGLIERGIERDRLLVIELDGDLCTFLRGQLPGCTIIQGDATRLREILDRAGIANVGAVVSGLPMVSMDLSFQRAVVHQALAVAGDDRVIQYSYSPLPPVPTRALGIEARLVGYVVRNFPPATVWRYRRAA